MHKKGWYRLAFEYTLQNMISLLKYVQYNKIKKSDLQNFANVFQFNDSFVPVSCFWVFKNVELCCW